MKDTLLLIGYILGGILLIGGIIYSTLPGGTGNRVNHGGPMASEDHAMIHPTGVRREFNLRSFNWGFDPSVMEVNAGDMVVLHMTSDDIDHGIGINEFLLNKRIQPGRVTNAEFLADKRGTFEIYCSVPCGEGHLTMKSKLIVK